MNVIEIIPIQPDQQALHGWFKDSGCGFFKSSSTCSKVESRNANNEIDVIRSEEGVNDLMYMKPEQAIKVMNRLLERVSYKQAWNKAQIGKHKSKDSKRAYEDAAKIFGEAIGDFMSEFRQYALGMDGELEKIGNSKKKIEGFEFQTPFYKLVLPQKAQGTNLISGVSKDDLLSMFQGQKINQAAPAVGNPSKPNTLLIIGGSVLGLAVIGTGIYFIKNKK